MSRVQVVTVDIRVFIVNSANQVSIKYANVTQLQELCWNNTDCIRIKPYEGPQIEDCLHAHNVIMMPIMAVVSTCSQKCQMRQ